MKLSEKIFENFSKSRNNLCPLMSLYIWRWKKNTATIFSNTVFYNKMKGGFEPCGTAVYGNRKIRKR